MTEFISPTKKAAAISKKPIGVPVNVPDATGALEKIKSATKTHRSICVCGHPSCGIIEVDEEDLREAQLLYKNLDHDDLKFSRLWKMKKGEKDGS